MSADLSPAEAVVLLNVNRPIGIEALKASLAELVAHGLVTVDAGGRGGFLGMEKREAMVRCHDRPDMLRELTEPSRSVFQVTRRVCATGPKPFSHVAKAFRMAYGGPTLEGFRRGYVMPALIQRGYVAEVRPEGDPDLVKPAMYDLTEAGRFAREQLDDRLREAASIPGFIGSDPTRAAATVASLGLLAMLVRELQPIRGEIAGASRARSGGAGIAYLVQGDTMLRLFSSNGWTALHNALDGAFSNGVGGQSGEGGSSTD